MTFGCPELLVSVVRVRAMVLRSVGPAEEEPLREEDVPTPEPGAGEVLVEVRACGVCRTDLHIVEGELPPRKLPLIPGHQVVGVVREVGSGVTKVSVGDRVGVTWLYWTCGECRFCRRGLENLCERALFTGYDADGGYAEYMVAREGFAFRLPEGPGDIELAPLLCAGVIGFRALRMCELEEGGRLGLFGFGSSAHIVIQIARHLGYETYVFTRSEEHQRLAWELGAAWVGRPGDRPPRELDAAIVFAPAGWVLVEALKVVGRGGRVVSAGIYMTPIPQLDYRLLYFERSIKSVANCTRDDVRRLLRVAEEARVRVSVEVFPLSQANLALKLLKTRGLRGSGVLKVR